jgi:peptide/nickel transport system ATP-binding protein/oligopeptide transport system ATP-binding protein
MNTEPLLQIEDLQVEFLLDRGRVRAVDGVGVGLEQGEILGLVGESGCGKSVTALSTMQLLATNARMKGKILLSGEDLTQKSEKEMEAIRGNKISMIFQEPMTSLNPVFSIQEQLGEAISLHQGGTKEEIIDKTVDALSLVGIPEPERRMREYPHQMSGGMQQRVMIAMALACNPDVLIADEPTTALDVTIQAQILALIRDLQEELGTGVIMITHDLGVIAQVAHRVAVMYAGKIVEMAGVDELFQNPRHPYTRSLLRTIPHIKGPKEKLKEISGMVPDLLQLPTGCRFHPRCEECSQICREQSPPQIDGDGWLVRCWLYE